VLVQTEVEKESSVVPYSVVEGTGVHDIVFEVTKRKKGGSYWGTKALALYRVDRRFHMGYEDGSDARISGD
jgi:hypothetical protein